MKTWKAVLIALLAVGIPVLLSFSLRKESKSKHRRTTYRSIPKGCVFRTVMGEEFSESEDENLTPENVISAINRGMDWVMKAQGQDGGSVLAGSPPRDPAAEWVSRELTKKSSGNP